MFAEQYLIKRPLLQALESEAAGAPVLLIDELDRADEAFEAFLLEILRLPDHHSRIRHGEGGEGPIVIVTSNRTREIHDALKRRASTTGSTTFGRARDRDLKSRVSGISARLSEQVVAFVQAVREEDLFKPPGVAETLDWATALRELDAKTLTPQVVGDSLGALLKYQDDIGRMQGDTLQKVLKEATSESSKRPGRDRHNGSPHTQPSS